MDNLQNAKLTTLPSLVIIKAGDHQLPIWPSPPSVRGVELPTFCPTVYQATIKKKICYSFSPTPRDTN
jgi:hypothetical protein